MIALLKKNSAFFIPYFLFLLSAGIALIACSKTDIALFINRYHASAADTFFKYVTLLGLGWLMLPVGLTLLFVRLRYVIIAIVTFLISFAINDSIKQLAGMPRPHQVFADLHQTLYFVPGVDIYDWNSFPSGHAATAFALFSAMALFSKKPVIKLMFFIAAFLVAYSRMYLSEHFLVDVYVASIIGVASTLFSYYLGTNWAWFNKFSARMDKPAILLRKT